MEDQTANRQSQQEDRKNAFAVTLTAIQNEKQQSTNYYEQT
jgi:hypothetical protein